MRNIQLALRVKDASGATSSPRTLTIVEDDSHLRPVAFVQFHASWDAYASSSNSALPNKMFFDHVDGIVKAEFQGVRIDVSCSQSWPTKSLSEPDRNSNYHRRMRLIHDACVSRGLSILYTLWRSPDWMHLSRPGVNRFPDAEYVDTWAKWAAWWAMHFPAVGYEIWNEPDLPAFSGSTLDDTVHYVSLLARAYDPIRTVWDGQSKVVIGGPANVKWRFNEDIYKSGAGFDVDCVHSYQGNWQKPPSSYDYTGVTRDSENRWTQFRSAGGFLGASYDGTKYFSDSASPYCLRAARARHGITQPIWVTEHGVSTSTESADANRSVGMLGVPTVWPTIDYKAAAYRIDQYEWLKVNMPEVRMVSQYCVWRPDLPEAGGSTSNNAMRLFKADGSMTEQGRIFSEYLLANPETRSLW